MSSTALSNGAAIACLALIAAGCAATGAKVVSRSDSGGVSPVQHLMVVSRLALVDKAWAGAFEKAMVSEFRKVSSSFRIQSRSALDLQSDKARYAEEITAFKPDAVLVVEPGDGTVDNLGRSLTRRFEAGLFRHYTERDRKELTWRATIMLEPAGSHIAAADMPSLVRDLVARLVADGILPKTRHPDASRKENGSIRPEATRQATKSVSLLEWLFPAHDKKKPVVIFPPPAQKRKSTSPSQEITPR